MHTEYVSRKTLAMNDRSTTVCCVLVLALDTSCAAVTAAVVRVDPHDTNSTSGGVELVAEQVTIDARAHGELLAPSIQTSLVAAGAGLADIGAVVVGLGPGPFTGLRVGIVTATVISDLKGIPAYGVCSLDGIAGVLADEHVLVAADARRREVYWARYRAGQRSSDPQVTKPAELRELMQQDAEAGLMVMAGAGARLYRDVLGLALRDVDYPRAEALVRVAVGRIRSSAPTEILTPLYLRRPDAVEPVQTAKTL
jgi:tRNA threonylcarbamoyl adenosine modification protein YeaZ